MLQHISRLLAILLCLGCGFALQAADIDRLKPDHPRLLLDDAGLAALQERIASDQRLAGYVDRLRAAAAADLTAPVATYHKQDGFRLLQVSRMVLARVSRLALLWRLEGDERYAERAKAELLAVAAFPDWNPVHFLDVSEMAAAVGIGLDWLWPVLSEDERITLRAAIAHHGILPYLSSHVATRYGGGVEGVRWVDEHSNWNLVCNGGMLMAAIAACGDDLPSRNQLRAVLSATLARVPDALAVYEPDGAYPEGTMYWAYGSFYASNLIASLESAFGSDFGLSAAPGFASSGDYILHAHGPQLWRLTYADSSPDRSPNRIDGAQMFFAQHFDSPLLADLHHRQMALAENAELITVWDLIWYHPGSDGTPADLPREAFFAGPTPLAVWRSAWNDPQALYVAMVGGSNPGPHGHLDLGSFTLAARGKHWVVDPGKDNYSVPGYWEYAADGRRWTIFRLGTQGHSLPMIGGRQQHTPTTVAFSHFGGGDAPGAMIDLSAAYAPATVQRGLRLLDDRQSLLVQDEIRSDEAIAWGLTVQGAITIAEDGRSALLTQGDERLRIHILQPSAGRLRSEAIPPHNPPHTPLPEDLGRLILDLEPSAGTDTTTVAPWFQPLTDQTLTAPEIRPLADWQELPKLESEGE